MRKLRIFAFAFLAVTAGTAPAWAFRVPDAGATQPTEHQIQLRDADSRPSPYAMNYADEAAQKLGVRDGQWEAFDSRSNPVMLKGGLDGGRPMLTLQWRPS
jgi:hypothetical protein